MTVAVPEAPLCPQGLEFRLAAKRRPLESFVWDRKVGQ